MSEDNQGNSTRCIQDLHLTESPEEKKRIEETNGGPLAFRDQIFNGDYFRQQLNISIHVPQTPLERAAIDGPNAILDLLRRKGINNSAKIDDGSCSEKHDSERRRY